MKTYQKRWAEYLNDTSQTPKQAVDHLIGTHPRMSGILEEIKFGKRQLKAYLYFKNIALSEGKKFNGLKIDWLDIEESEK